MWRLCCILHDQHELKVPESQSVTHFYCESHLLCMHFSHIGTQKIWTSANYANTQCRMLNWFQNCTLAENYSCSSPRTKPSTDCDIYSIHIDTFLAVGRDYVLGIRCFFSHWALYKNIGEGLLSLFTSLPGVQNKSVQESAMLKDQFTLECHSRDKRKFGLFIFNMTGF